MMQYDQFSIIGEPKFRKKYRAFPSQGRMREGCTIIQKYYWVSNACKSVKYPFKVTNLEAILDRLNNTSTVQYGSHVFKHMAWGINQELGQIGTSLCNHFSSQ